ncbi:PfkB family carbohydrate kinase [Actinorugispora endophytica]|uniref:Sugar/nucleoside kinase (Ribokinase family) n=1 Tax=Actinorugispora endophytica TaxID=1605990 RepID=A0A4R6UVY0_9ACTN|nr:PfkB family carbohydrate kinase [Actinorugispora endophytica]TDQ51548.1 sugar/nucleoside kinase (ribokinase family) [Actinorugispora endophytica]
MNRLIHCGSVITDLVMTVEALPPPGGDTLATSTSTSPGGGFNVMAAAARSGMRVLYAGTHGTGPNGDMARAALAGEGIEVLHPPRADVDTGFCVALVDAGAERTFVSSIGAEGDLDGADLARVRVEPGDFVYVTGYSFVSGNRGPDLVRWLGELPGQARVVFDPAPVVAGIDPGVLGEVLGRTDVLSLNAREAGLVTGLDRPEEAAAELARRGRPGGLVVLRDSARGCLVARSGDEPVLVPGFAVTAVDTNGAGDAHTGAFVAALAGGADPFEAARRANGAAAVAVTRYGPATAPDSGELRDFLAAREPAGARR